MDFHLPLFIEIETSTYCNRKCPWCPNGKFDLRSKQSLMNFSLLKKIITELKSLNYTGWIALHNFNEPLLNERLDDEINYIHKTIPKALLGIFTNGDYLQKNHIQTYLNSLNFLRVNLYSQINGEKDYSSVFQKWADNHGLGSITWKKKENFIGMCMEASIEQLTIEVVIPNIRIFNYRGGLTNIKSNKERKIKCKISTLSSAIDYMGNVKMCCNIFADHPKHFKYIMGNINQKSFLEIWNSERFHHYRSLHRKAEWIETDVCKYCNHLHPSERGGCVSLKMPS